MQQKQPQYYSHARPAPGTVPSTGISAQNRRVPCDQAQDIYTTAAQGQSNFTPYSSNTFQCISQQQQQTMLAPTVSPLALKTFAPQHHQNLVAPPAPQVPIQSLQAGKAMVCVSGRTVRASEIKAFPDKFDTTKQRWLQSFTIKDDFDSIDVKFWHKSQEHLDLYSQITLDQVVHVVTDEVKLNTSPGPATQSTPSTSSPFLLNLSEGKFGHRIDLGGEEESNRFRTALGANAGGTVPSISIRQIISALNSIGNHRFNLVVCVKEIVKSASIVTKNGLTAKTELTVFDAQGGEMSMIIWGELLAKAVQQWIPFTSRAQASIYGIKPQITIGFQTHIQIDPICKNVEWLKHFSSQFQDMPIDLNPDAAEITASQIKSVYRIIDITKKAELLSALESVYGCCYVLVSEFEIDDRFDVLTAKWWVISTSTTLQTALAVPSCTSTISSFKMEVCPGCNVMPSGERCWNYNLSRLVSFIDDTAELHHPMVPSEAVEKLLGFKPNEFSSLSMPERSQLKLSWSDFKKAPAVEILSIEPTNLLEFENAIHATAS
ncbi:hypothetical protein BGZ83_010047 [Gryganskiella cystojenkinii]|nr:hypothetical protein BGZ83_010047 [Gryganskiella cystojenkinii]